MTKSEIHAAEFSTTAAGPAEVAFGIMLKAERWPQLFSTIVHTDFALREEGKDEVRVWGMQGENAVRAWTTRRVIDHEGMRIAFTNEPAIAPMTVMGGEWSFSPQPDGTTKINIRHEFGLPDNTKVPAGRIIQELERHSKIQLEQLRQATERSAELDDLILDFEDPLYVGGAAEDAWKMLYEADKWPERLAHVAKLTMTEEVAGIQFFDMDTTTSDGRPHTTRSVRVCLPYSVIVYKQLQPPPLLSVHTGHWRFTPTREGVIVGARHTVTINPERLDVLGAGATVEDARRYLRKVLSTNSMGNLRLAKGYAEEQRG